MNKKLRELLKKINDKKEEIRSLQGQGKTQEMEEKMNELKDMQKQFNILMELEDDDASQIEEKIKDGSAKPITGSEGEKGEKRYTRKQVENAFVHRIVNGLRRRRTSDEDMEILDAMTEKDPDSGTGESDGGITVPKDVQTTIKELRRSEDDLEQYVNIEGVTTMSGSRVIETEADTTPWPDVEEGAEMQEQDTPKLKLVKYIIKKKGGILKTTYELLKDSAENILAYLNKWIAKKSRATRNAEILKVLDSITSGKEKAVSTIDDIKTVFNVSLDPAITESSIVLTNQSGFNYLDKLKDERGDYIIQPSVTEPTQRMLFGRYPIAVVSEKVLKSEEVKSSDKVTAYKYPLYMGDLKEAITLFDREKITIELSTEAGDLWAKDQTGIKARDRFDVQAVDTGAVVKGVITETVAG